MQFGVGRGTDAGRIAQANILAGRGEIEIQLLVEIRGIALEVENTASGAGAQRFDMNVIARKQERTGKAGQAAGQSRIRDGAVRDLKMALGQRLGQRAADRHAHGHQTRRGEVGIEHGEQFHIEASIGCEIEATRAGELYDAMHGQIRSLTYQMKLLDVNRLVCYRKVNWILVVNVGFFNIEREGRQISADPPILWMLQWTVQIDHAGGGGASRELAVQKRMP